MRSYCLAAATGDASTKLKMSWKNPNYSGQHFTKILVIGMSNNLETRADFEVALASGITRPGIVGVAGTDILLRPTAGPLDLVYIKEQIRAYKIDAVVGFQIGKDREPRLPMFPANPTFSLTTTLFLVTTELCIRWFIRRIIW